MQAEALAKVIRSQYGLDTVIPQRGESFDLS
jgi:hypothetical protein